MIRRGGYGTNFSQRFGALPRLDEKRKDVKRVWIQAVSVGEVLAVGPLLAALKQAGMEIYLTTTTSTGYRMALDRYTHLVIGIGYFPIDFWFFTSRSWRGISPDMVVLTEGERWPEHIHQAKVRGIPLICVNARMSDRGFRRMKLVPHMVRRLFDGISLFLPSSQQDGERLIELGFLPERIQVTGNIKLDINIPELDAQERAKLRKNLGLPESGFLLVGASTWTGEENSLLGALRSLRKEGIAASLLLVPRHAERRIELAALLRDSEFKHHFRSKGMAASEVDVAVGDTTGELRNLLQLADLVFVGKSLAPHHEGQTPVEAACLGKPVIFGPEMSNFRQISAELIKCGAARSVKNASDMVDAVVELAKDSVQRERMSASAKAWHKANRGALDRTIQALNKAMAR
jgi:3-deoxy-D-manno-octulosonic-acid transferase